VAVQNLQAEGVDPSADPDALAAERDSLTGADIGDKVFPHFIGARLPVGVTGLLIAAVFAAAMSTVSTSLNSSATLLMRDYYQRYVNREASERQSMVVLYGATVVWGVLGTGVALLLVRVTSALDAWWTLSGVFGGGMLGLFLLGMISRRAGNRAAVAGVCLGILVIGWMTLSTYLPDGWSALRSSLHAFMIPVLGTLTILLTGLAVSRFTTARSKVASASDDSEDLSAGSAL
jgi:SSS family solute:Na+ symporter